MSYVTRSLRVVGVTCVLVLACWTSVASAQTSGDNYEPPSIVPTQVVEQEVAPLPRTGSNLTVPLTRIAIALLAGGGLVVYVARRRRSSAL